MPMTETKSSLIHGPLRANPANPRYFTDDSAKAVYLTGSHTWANFQDMLREGDQPLDYDTYLDFLEEHNHNFIRMWMWEQAVWVPWTTETITFTPVAYARTGPGEAMDGKPKFDLDRWDESFFARLRTRVEQAGERGIYVSVMLFEGWSIKKPWIPGNPWLGHPFNGANNINGVDGDSNGDGLADIHSLEIPAINNRQEAYVKKVIDTINDLDNVLYEIINEPSPDARTLYWQYYMVRFIHEYEMQKPKRHPVGMTPIGHTEKNALLFQSDADWISLGQGDQEEYKFDPPEASGLKVILNDTDHLWGLGGDYKWVWKSFTRGLNPIFMDPWYIQPGLDDPKNMVDYVDWPLMRKSLGYARAFADRMNLNSMVPSGRLSSSGYCLAEAGSEYLVYLPEKQEVVLSLPIHGMMLHVEWFEPATGKTEVSRMTASAGQQTFVSPFKSVSVLYIKVLMEGITTRSEHK